MKNYTVFDLISDALMAIFTFSLAITLAGQFFTSTVSAIFAVIAVLLMFIKPNEDSPLNLLYFRRIILIVGIITVLAIQITGSVLTSGVSLLTTSAILAAGMRTTPVYITMGISWLIVTIWHLWDTRK